MYAGVCGELVVMQSCSVSGGSCTDRNECSLCLTVLPIKCPLSMFEGQHGMLGKPVPHQWSQIKFMIIFRYVCTERVAG